MKRFKNVKKKTLLKNMTPNSEILVMAIEDLLSILSGAIIRSSMASNYRTVTLIYLSLTIVFHIQDKIDFQYFG